MSRKPLDILLLFDSHIPPDQIDDCQSLFQSSDDWRDERDVLTTLKELGHQVRPWPVYESAASTIEYLCQQRPDIVFFMCESIGGNRALSANLLSTIELLNIPYTGACPEALILCRDKGASKAILKQNGISVPKFQIVHRGQRISHFDKFGGPVIVKPLGLEGSEGITLASIASSKQEATDRAQEVFANYADDVIIEEFVAGRELYIGAVGNGRADIFPPQELFFGDLPDQDQRIATYKAKWDKSYRKKWGIDSGGALAIDEKVWKRIEKQCRQMFKVLRLTFGYVRFDLRLREDGTFCIIEANPNPAINREDDFPSGAENLGLSYSELLDRILDLGMRRPVPRP